MRAIVLQPRYLLTSLFNLFGILFIFFVPAFSHWFALPIYLFEPMRIVVILALIHTQRANAYLLALTLPVFSFFVSDHPVFLKSLLISVELCLNVWFFFLIVNKFANKTYAFIVSIIASKILYYLLKFALISFALLDSSLISTPLYIQALVLIMLSAYFIVVNKYSNNKKAAI